MCRKMAKPKHIGNVKFYGVNAELYSWVLPDSNLVDYRIEWLADGKVHSVSFSLNKENVGLLEYQVERTLRIYLNAVVKLNNAV